MKIEFPALESEPLVYFLFHSGAFVAALGTIFFLLGLWFGGLIWARYKRRYRLLQEEHEAQREEIISLKRKLAEQVMRPPSPPLTMPLPTFEERSGAEERTQGDGVAGDESTAEFSGGLGSGAEAEHHIPEAFPAMPALGHETLGSGIRRGLAMKPRPAKASVERPAPVPVLPPEPAPSAEAQEREESGLEPFGFLMGEAVDEPRRAESGSPLKAIIAPKAPAQAEPVTETDEVVAGKGG